MGLFHPRDFPPSSSCGQIYHVEVKGGPGRSSSGGRSGPRTQRPADCPVCFHMFSFPAFEKQGDLQVAHQESIKLRGHMSEGET